MEELPAGLGHQIDGLLEGNAGQAAALLGGFIETAKGAMGIDV